MTSISHGGIKQASPGHTGIFRGMRAIGGPRWGHPSCRKLRRKVKYLLIVVVVLIGAVAVYQQMVAGRARSGDVGLNSNGSSWMRLLFAEKDSVRYTKGLTLPLWKPQYMGRANLHIFEDWCGGSIDDLRHNAHYPLYPHTRTTVSKLAVSPQWTNYGLRIFGYLHPYADGDYVFALGSDDNSELWLSLDESPVNARLLAWVGKTGSEWTAPGEFDKYASQTSRSVWLSVHKRYFFEVILKQNGRGTDHVEVAWQLLNKDFHFNVIESEYISLYADESRVLISNHTYTPQTPASHQHASTNQRFPLAEMVKHDPRDSFYQVPLVDSGFLEGILPDCSYKPSYLIKGFHLRRYQGLEFIQMSYVYPNDNTRLTHMETQDSCFYPERLSSIKMKAGVSRYMMLNYPGTRNMKNQGKDSDFKWDKYSAEEFDDKISKGETQPKAGQSENALLPDNGDDFDDYTQKRRRKLFSVVIEENANKLPNGSDVRQEKRSDDTLLLSKQHREDTNNVNIWMDTNTNLNMVQKENLQSGTGRVDKSPREIFQWSDPEGKIGKMAKKNNVDNAPEKPDEQEDDDDSAWLFEDESNRAKEEDFPKNVMFDKVIKWNQTFHVNFVDLQALRSDWSMLRCNVSGNLLLRSSDALPIVTSFMQQLNNKHDGRFTLVRVINVVKRLDGTAGSRYLLELELKDVRGRQLRLSHYIYAQIRKPDQSDNRLEHPKPRIQLCNPVGLRWNPSATVHFVLPVKNQARWVQQLIVDMETLFKKSGDTNFNLIIIDYHSTDMNVKKALAKSSIPRYQYMRLSGNFQRSAGLQAGIDLIDDDHSIVFLCDLHIHFPHSIVDTIRKHCVEGHMAFAPIVMRLDCGVTPMESRGYWEVNGFGLLGIYKSDLVAAGGMNTKEFQERWGGEDWELLDRILQAGLEVDRIFLRNFLHHYHSKRGMWNRRMPRNHK